MVALGETFNEHNDRGCLLYPWIIIFPFPMFYIILIQGKPCIWHSWYQQYDVDDNNINIILNVIINMNDILLIISLNKWM